MKGRICLLVLFASALLILTPQTSLAEKKGTFRPLSGSLVGNAQLFIASDIPNSPCPVFVAITIAAGNLSHLGLVAAKFSHCTTPLQEGGTTITLGSLALTAANGDMLYCTYSKVDGLSPFVVQIASGTGRFKNVSGEFNLNWEITEPSEIPEGYFSPFPWWASIEGKISY
jgi:hypothetical protein